MKARKLLVVAGCLGITAAFAAAPMEAKREPPAKPLLDRDGRPAPGNVIGKGEPRPQPKRDGGTAS